MPARLATPCRHPGCAALVYQRGGYCPAHARHRAQSRDRYDVTKRVADPARAFAATVRSSARWQRVRRCHKAANPTCCDPLGHHGEWPALATQTHHIKSLERCHIDGDLESAFDPANLASLCTRCHAAIEAMERRGEPTEALFRRSPSLDQSIYIA